MIGARVPTPDGPNSPPPPPVDLRPASPRLPPRRRRPLVITATAAVLVLVAALVGALLRPSGPSDLEAAGFAESFVAAFLSAGEGTEASLLPYLGYTPALDGMNGGDFFVAHLITERVTAHNHGADVIIGARVLERSDAGYVDPGPVRLLVRLGKTEAGFRALALPEPAPPAPAAPSPPSSRENTLPASGTEAASGFVHWYLTGTVPINGVAPAGGYQSAELVSLEHTNGEALAGVVARTHAGHGVRLDLRIVERNGAWTISPGSS